jgi:hypothetical protein
LALWIDPHAGQVRLVLRGSMAAIGMPSNDASELTNWRSRAKDVQTVAWRPSGLNRLGDVGQLVNHFSRCGSVPGSQ